MALVTLHAQSSTVRGTGAPKTSYTLHYPATGINGSSKTEQSRWSPHVHQPGAVCGRFGYTKDPAALILSYQMLITGYLGHYKLQHKM